MSRSPQRLVSFVLLLSLLTGLLAFDNQPTSAVAAPSGTSLVAAPRNPAPQLPNPTGVTSTSLPPSFINSVRAVHGSTHTANGALDGSYTQESLATHTYSGSVQATDLISTTAERYRAVEYPAPATPFTHDELTFDYEAKFSGRTSGGVKVYALLSFWDPYNNDWSTEYEIANGTFSYTTGATELKERPGSPSVWSRLVVLYAYDYAVSRPHGCRIFPPVRCATCAFPIRCLQRYSEILSH